MWFSLKSNSQIRKKVKRALEKQEPTLTDEHGEIIRKIPRDIPLDCYHAVELNKIKQIIVEGCNRIKFALPLAYLFDEKYENLEYLLGNTDIQLMGEVMKSNIYVLPDEDDNNPQQQPLGNLLHCNSPESFQDFLNNYVSYYRGVNNNYKELDMLIHSFYRNEKVKNLVEQKLILRLPESARDFIKALQSFFEIILKRMYVTPDQEFRNDFTIAEKYQENFELMESIDRLEAEIGPISRRKDDIMNKSKEELDAVENEIIAFTGTVNQNMKRNRKIFKKRMDWDWKVHEMSNYVNVEMLAKKKQQLDKLIKSHIEIEAVERASKFKQESSLQFLINKYDTNMKEKKKRFDDLTEKWKSMRMEIALAEKKFEDTDKVYAALVDEKNRYETDLWNKKLFKIQCNIAVRKIQRYFRIYLKLAGPNIMKPLKQPPKGKK